MGILLLLKYIFSEKGDFYFVTVGVAPLVTLS